MNEVSQDDNFEPPEELRKLSESKPSAEVGNEKEQEAEAPYSSFTNPQKLGIVLLAAFAGVFSPLSSFIYYPALKAVAEDLHTSLSKINLTITSYMVVSAVAPTVWGDMADRLGRRPIFLFMFAVYIATNIGLSVQNSYSTLLVLRMVQSASGSGDSLSRGAYDSVRCVESTDWFKATLGIGYGIVGDIATSAERGFYMGILSAGPQFAPALGPLFGGILTQLASWRWTFGFLALLAALCFGLMAIALPETARTVVGDGSIPARRLSRSLLSLWREKRSGRPVQSVPVAKWRFTIPNPLKSAYIFFYKDTMPVILIYAISYTNYCCLQASLSSLFITLYGFGELAAGAIYIPFGVGCFLASFLSGKLLTYDYERTAKTNNLPVDRVRGQDLSRFPIEKARFRSMPVLLVFIASLTCAYSWAIDKGVHFAVPLVFQFFIGGAITIVFNMCGTLLVDQHPLQPATAQASLNLIRCLMAAGGLAALQPLINAVGVGWCYTVFSGISVAALPLCLLEMALGMRWRLARMDEPGG